MELAREPWDSGSAAALFRAARSSILALGGAYCHLKDIGTLQYDGFFNDDGSGEVLGTPSGKSRRALDGGPGRIVTPCQSL